VPRNFSKEKISDLILLKAKRIEDVEILALNPDSEKVQEVAKARIAQFK
jgi:transcription elongation factor